MDKKVVAIHQPNFLPWLGYFHKLIHSDIFVFFDDVQFPRGKSFASRVLIKSPNGKQWLTVPVSGKGELKLINSVHIGDNLWVKKALKSISFNYQKAQYFQEIYPKLELILKKDHSLLIELNLDLIKFIVDYLDIDTELKLSSDICRDQDLTADEKIVFILKKLDAGFYVSGAGSGSKRYIDEKVFESNHIKLIWQHFDHPVYPQLYGQFEPNLSILDMLFNCGRFYSRKILSDIPITLS